MQLLPNQQHYQKMLDHLERKHRLRTLPQQQGIDFCSNDYLAFSQHTRIRTAIQNALNNGLPVGAGGSRLLGGNHAVFQSLETMAAHFYGSEACLYFNSGYAANVAVFATLPKRGDRIFFDSDVHASILDGIKLSRASAETFHHYDVSDLQHKINAWRHTGGIGQIWVAISSLGSMQGDQAPLHDFIQLFGQLDGFLFIDEAHATGVFGKDGRGLAASYLHDNHIITLHTCGKALGLTGALLCTNQLLHHYLVNHARPFIYSTAPSPLIAVGVQEALKILVEEPQHQQELTGLYRYANECYVSLTGEPGSNSHILPVYLASNELTMQTANRLNQHGFAVQAIRPPTVPSGTARIRISITRHVTKDHINRLFTCLSDIMSTA